LVKLVSISKEWRWKAKEWTVKHLVDALELQA